MTVIDDDMLDGPADNGQFHDETYGDVESGSTAPSVSYIDEFGLRDEEMAQLRNNRDIASVIERWSQSLTNSGWDQPNLGMFNRDRWNYQRHTFALMSQCAWAVKHDDILSTLADTLEGLAFQKNRFELFDKDQQDFWNQWAGTINLDARLREMFRELYKVSQVYVGIWWEKKVYSVRDSEIETTIEEFEQLQQQKNRQKLADAQRALGAPVTVDGTMPDPTTTGSSGSRGGNRRRKKKFPVEVPTALNIFDPTKIMPVGTLMFGRERFCYVASPGEMLAFDDVLAGTVVDGTILQLIEGKYEPTGLDRVACGEVGVDSNNLYLFKQDAIFRHSLTRSQYERFAPLRMESILEIVELKEHLRQSDRATLVGQSNFIVLITKGTDKIPARNAEVENLKEQARVIARMPVLVGDHRLHVEIISPAMDNTLIESRYQVLDSRLVFKALQSFMPIVQGGRISGVVTEMSRVIARGIESRRQMLVRSLEESMFQLILDRNQGVLDEEPTLTFTPKRVSLDFQADVLGQILKLRDRGDISRETMLEELDYDQDVEVLRRARERITYDDVFESATPFSSPLANPYGSGNPFDFNGDPQPQAVPPPAQPPAGNVGPSGQPRTEGGRPPGVAETTPRKKS